MYCILLRYGELTLKGKNRKDFERKLLENINKQLADFDIVIKRDRSRVYVEQVTDNNKDKIIEKLKKIPGIYSFSLAEIINNDIETIKDFVLQTFDDSKPLFRINSKRLNKKYPLISEEINKAVGGHVLINKNGLEGLKVQMKDVQQEIMLEIHQEKCYVFTDKIKAMGGLPIGSVGKGVVMLSGGIDSPVAAILAMKRGIKIQLAHFSSPPYTNAQSLEKVINLTSVLQEYDQDIKLNDFQITDLQVAINKNCNERMQVVLLRRMMLRVVENVMAKHKVIITGENIGQVASQTLEAMEVTNQAIESLILRPLLTYDKEEIITLAQRFGTYLISIKPFDDCCVLFMPKSPTTKPKLDKILIEESKIDYMTMIEQIERDQYDCQTIKDQKDFNNYL